MKKIFFFGTLCFLFAFFPLAAQTPPGSPELSSRSAVVMDAATGTVIYSKNSDDEIPPASLTKLMTMHLAFKEISAGRASLDEIITLPEESWAVNQPYASSLMYLANGQQASLRQLLLGMAIPSGNDAAAAVALRFAPSVDEFVAMMNRESAALGFSVTRFVDPAGYWEQNMTTAGEFARFCRVYLEAHPESTKDFHSVREFVYPLPENVAEQYRENPGTHRQYNRNTLLETVEGVDGLKTGFIPESGYNIALTAERDGTRFITVILGGPAEWGGDRLRDEDGEALFKWAFDNYKTVKPRPDAPEPARIWKGRKNNADLIFGEPLDFTAPAGRGEDLRWETELEDPLVAPLSSGTQVGNLVLYDSQGELRKIPLLLYGDAEKGGFFKRIFDSIRLLFHKKRGPK